LVDEDTVFRIASISKTFDGDRRDAAVEEPNRVLTSVACVAVGVRATIVALHASRQSAVACSGRRC
jgi:hypothetical protein